MEQTLRRPPWQRAVAALAALVLAVGLLPAAALPQAGTAWAASSTTYDSTTHVASAVVSGTTTYYDTLADAISAADSESTVTLLASTTVSSQIQISKTVTLDLNGQTLTLSGSYTRLLYVASGGNLTICDNSDSSSGEITNAGSTSSYGLVDVYGTLTVTGGTFTDVAAANGSLIRGRSGSTINISGGAFTCTGSCSTWPSGNTGDNRVVNGTGTTLTITGGTFSTQASIVAAIYCDSSSTVKISGATISTVKTSGIEMDGGTLALGEGTSITVSELNDYGNGTSYGFLSSAVGVGGNATVTISGGTYTAPYAVYVYSSGGTVTITGGTFVCNDDSGAALRVDDVNYSYYYGGDTTKASSTITVSAGSDVDIDGVLYVDEDTSSSIVVASTTYASSGTYVLDEAADGTYTLVSAIYVAKVTDTEGNLYNITTSDDDGNTTSSNNGGYYADLQEALSATAGSYKTVVLLQDATCSSALTIPREDTLDLGGHTLTLAAGSSEEGGTVNNSIYLSTSNGQAVIENGAIADESYSLRTFYVAANASLDLEDVAVEVGENVTSSVIWEESGTYTSGSGDDAESVYAAPSVTLGDGASISCSCTAVTVRSATNDNKVYAASLTVEDGAAISSSGTCIAIGGTSTSTDSDGNATTTSYAGSTVSIEGGTITTTGYRAISVYQQGDTLSISGGKISAATAEIATPYSTTALEQNATISVSGGYFAHEVASAYIASGYVAATADLDGYGYTVSPLDVDFWGGSLYVASLTSSTATDSASLRFGFCWDGLPDGATVASFGWAWGTSESTVEAATSATVAGKNYRAAGSLSTDPEGASGTVANLVLTNIGSKYYDTPIYVRMFVTYKASDGVAVTVCTDVVSRDVLYVANKALSSYESGTDGYTYLSGLAAAYQTKTGATSATCAHNYSS